MPYKAYKSLEILSTLMSQKMVCFALMLLLGCTGAPERGLGVPLELAFNETAAAGPLSIRFADLLEDSRCRADTACVWSGRFRGSFEVRRMAETGFIDLPFVPGAKQTGEIFGHKFMITKVEPEKLFSGKRVNLTDYSVTLVVTGE
jgi:hypothetical protein